MSASPPPASGLTARSLSFAYAQATVLADINLAVAEGEFVSLLGASGSGKSTLLRLLAGLEEPGRGQVAWRGTPLAGPSLERGIVFQEYSLFPWFSLQENVALAVAKARPGLSPEQRRELADKYLGMVGLSEARLKYPHELSGGMRQRGAIARTLALGSPVLLMDEPFGALDPVNRMRLQELLLEIWSKSSPRRTVVFVTHDVDEALFLGDRVLILGSNPGRIIGELAVNFPRPRKLEDLNISESFRAIRAEISGYYHRDARRQLQAEAGVVLPGESI
jgi:NitT/TauT family transport system ATP-binding protein